MKGNWHYEAVMVSSLPLADELAAVMSRISNLLLTEETVNRAVRLITSVALQVLPAARGAGVTLIDPLGRKTSTAATDAWVEQADELQYELGEGPCLTAWGLREPVRIDDLGSEQRWPQWRAAAAELGLVSSLSVPLRVPGGAIGAVKVYATSSAAFDAAALRLLEAFAEQAAILLVHVQAKDTARRISDELGRALAERDLISTAKGILVARDNIDVDEALQVLMDTSRGTGLPLREVARRLLAAAAPADG